MGSCSSNPQTQNRTARCGNGCGRPANPANGFNLCNACFEQQKQIQMQMQMQRDGMISPNSPPPYSGGVIQQRVAVQPGLAAAPAPAPVPVRGQQPALRVICPQCQTQLGLPYYAPQAQCPRCQTVFAIPQTAAGQGQGGQQVIIIEQQPQRGYYNRGGYDAGTGLAAGLVGGFLLGEALGGGFGGGWGDGGWW